MAILPRLRSLGTGDRVGYLERLHFCRNHVDVWPTPARVLLAHTLILESVPFFAAGSGDRDVSPHYLQHLPSSSKFVGSTPEPTQQLFDYSVYSSQLRSLPIWRKHSRYVTGQSTINHWRAPTLL